MIFFKISTGTVRRANADAQHTHADGAHTHSFTIQVKAIRTLTEREIHIKYT